MRFVEKREVMVQPIKDYTHTMNWKYNVDHSLLMCQSCDFMVHLI